MPEQVKDKVIAFVCGDVSVMGFTFLKIPEEIVGIEWKVIATVIIGLFGGIAGVAGKDLYAYIKSRVIQRKTKKPS